MITGGAGFIGSNLARYFVQKGETVKVIDNFSNSSVDNVRDILENPKFKLIKGNICDISLLEKHLGKDVDTVFHLAAKIHVDESIKDPKSFIDVNVLGTLNILDIAVKHDLPRIIFASSSEVYGTAQYFPMDENHPLNPASPYAATKVAGDRLCFSYFNTYGLNVTIVRNFNIFGPNQKDTGYGGAIAIFTRRVMNNLPPKIYGDGLQTRDYMYIDDAVQAYSKVLDTNKLKGEAINFGTGKDISILNLANKIIEITGKKNIKPVHVEKRLGEVMKLQADIKKAQNLIGFSPKFDLIRGLTEYINWFNNSRNSK